MIRVLIDRTGFSIIHFISYLKKRKEMSESVKDYNPKKNT